VLPRLSILCTALWIAACAAAPRPAPAPAPVKPAPAQIVHHLDDPDVNRPADKPLLSIDWSKPHEPLELWKLIAPTGADWEAKLEEVPDAQTDALALALLAGGNFACATPAPACSGAPPDLPDPAPAAGFDDPCLRRVLALWSLAQLDRDQLPKAALRAIAALPPPESQLVASAIAAVPDADQDFRLELLAIAWQAGQHDIVAGAVGNLDDAHLVTALTKHHIDAALDQLTADRHRAEFLGAIVDDKLAAPTRNEAMIEVAAADTVATGKDVLAPDLRKVLIAAVKSPDCAVAAAAAHMFETRGDHRFGPKRPPARKPAAMMHALCVVASYEQLQRADEPSYLLGYVPAAGLDIGRVTYDPYSDPHTTETTDHVKRDEVVLPELEDMIRAFGHCKDTVCTSDEREFHFGFKPGPGGDLLLTRIDVVERPPCGMIAP
jgi:hypothetical protein